VLQFGQVPLSGRRQLRFVIRNLSAVPAAFRLKPKRFPAATSQPPKPFTTKKVRRDLHTVRTAAGDKETVQTTRHDDDDDDDDDDHHAITMMMMMMMLLTNCPMPRCPLTGAGGPGRVHGLVLLGLIGLIGDPPPQPRPGGGGAGEEVRPLTCISHLEPLAWPPLGRVLSPLGSLSVVRRVSVMWCVIRGVDEAHERMDRFKSEAGRRHLIAKYNQEEDRILLSAGNG
jgi:hypothetical protein